MHLFFRQLQEFGNRDEVVRIALVGHHSKVVVQARDKQGVVGEGEGQFGVHRAAGVVDILERVQRPVTLGLRIAAEIHAVGEGVTGGRIDVEEGVYTSFQGGTGDEPGVEAEVLPGGA